MIFTHCLTDSLANIIHWPIMIIVKRNKHLMFSIKWMKMQSMDLIFNQEEQCRNCQTIKNIARNKTLDSVSPVMKMCCVTIRHSGNTVTDYRAAYGVTTQAQ